MSAAVLECVRNFAVSAWTRGSAISAINWSYFASTDASLSNMAYPPDTGGRNATSSPSCRRVVNREYVSFTAHDTVRPWSASPGNSCAKAFHASWAVAPSGSWRESSDAPAISRRRANSRTVTCTRDPSRPGVPVRRRDRPSPLRPTPGRPRSARASRSGQFVSIARSRSDRS